MNRIIQMLLCLVVFLLSCEEDQPEPLEQENLNEIRAYAGTQSPGDVWTFSLNFTTSTFTGTWDNGTLTDISDDVTLEGSFTILPSGFIKMTLGNATPDRPSLPEDGSAFFYAYEIPELALFAQPAGSISGEVIVAAEINSCTDVLADYNYIIAAPPSSYNPTIEEAYGTLTFSGSAGSIAVSGMQKSLDCIGGPCTLNTPITGTSGSCTGSGELSISSTAGLVARGQVTPSGTFMLDRGPGNGGLFGLKTDVSIASTDVSGITMRGFAFVPSMNISEPVKMDFPVGATTGSAQLFTDLETNSIDTANLVDITLSTFTNGQVTGFMTHNSGGTTNLAGALAKNSSQRIMVLIGTTDQTSAPAFLIILGA